MLDTTYTFTLSVNLRSALFLGSLSELKCEKKIIKKFLIIFNQIILLYLNFRQRTTSNM